MSNFTPSDYTPPSSEEMVKRQNDVDALRLLIAQRRLYSRAKRWLGLRWFGMLVIGLAAPIVSVVWPELAVVSGAVAGLWIFLGRTLIMHVQSNFTAKAAATQEYFDFYVFGMTSSIERSITPSLEDISAIAGPDESLMKIAESEKLLDWYSINSEDPGVVAVAIAQRTNVAYADRLLRTTAIAWAVTTFAWMLFLLGVTLYFDLSLATFLVGVFIPVLPAFLDVVQYVVGVYRAARERADVARSIERRLKDDGERIEENDLLVWQGRLYDLRRSTPQVPDLIYRMKRVVNERVMKAAASQLGRRARRVDDGEDN